MKTPAILFALATITASSAALAFDDDMMGTVANGRMSGRSERDYRVQDPEMDREEMVIDREKRQGRNTVDAQTEGAGKESERHEPFKGKLPD